MSEQTIRDRAQQVNDQVKTRVEQVRQDAQELYNKVESRVSDLLNEYKSLDNPLEALKESSSKLQESARELQKQQLDHLENLGNQVAELLGLPTQEDLKKLNKKLTTVSNKVKKLEKATKAK